MATKLSPVAGLVRLPVAVLFCRAALPLSRQTLTFAAGIIRRHRVGAATDRPSHCRLDAAGDQMTVAMGSPRPRFPLMAVTSTVRYGCGA
jgi:hypothetical protein